ncbi:MAG: serine hydrolase domain-containing protein [Archangium sp.]
MWSSYGVFVVFLSLLSGCALGPRVLTPSQTFEDVKLTIVETTEPDAMKAIAQTWKGTTPITTDGEPVRWPATHGWDEEVSASFSSRDGKLRLRAEVRRFKSRTFVLLAEGDGASLSKREAQIDKLVGELAPPDLKPETFAGRTPNAQLDTAKYEAFLGKTFEQLEVPGAAVAVIHHGKVIFEKSFGTTKAKGFEAITPDTLFLMASVTKPMTTFMQAALVDAGLFKWNSKVTTLLPDFALADQKLTQQLELWHMSCACTGMPRRDIENLVEYGGVTGEQRIASMREMQPTTALGETFQYSNLMVAAGGFAAAHAFAPKLSLNDAYVKAMDEKVFAPLGMTSSTADFKKATSGKYAAPHALDLAGRTQELPINFEANVVPIAPAGAVWSTLRDMEKYALAELRRGGKVVSELNYAERTRRRIGEPSSGYALGIDIEQKQGLTIIGHDGGADGFGTSLYLVPELELGLVILTNVRNGTPLEQLPFNSAAKRRLLELVFDNAQPVADTIVTFAMQMHREFARQAVQGVEVEPDAAWLASLAGNYTSTNIGSLEIRGNVFDVGEWQVHFGRRGDDLVMLDAPFAGTPIAFDAEAGTLTLPDPQTKYVFTRAGSATSPRAPTPDRTR